MPGCRLILVGLLLSSLVSSISAADPANPNLRQLADTAAAAGRWDQALAHYLKLNETTSNAVLRERIRESLRQVKRQQRQRDESFQQFVGSLRPSEALNLYAEVLEKLNQLHAEPSKAGLGLLVRAGLEELDQAIQDLSFQQRHLKLISLSVTQRFRQSLTDHWGKKPIPTVKEARGLAFELIQQAQAELGLKNASVLVCELLCGACASVDEYTIYLHATAEQSAQTSPILELAQYGLMARLLAGELVIEAVRAGSWAALHTPLRKGDRITRFNGVTPNPMQLKELAQAVRSPSGLGHELELQPEPHLVMPNLTLPSPLPSIYGVSLLNMRDGIGYLRLASFKESTPREFEEAVQLLKNRGARVLVVDARGNPGGAFPAAIQTAQRLLPTGIIATTQSPSAEFAHRVFSSDAGLSAHDLPVVLLIDHRTMSAAEVVAAAWKDHERAYLIGLPTYGKGAIQSKVRLQAMDQPEKPSRSGAVVVTIAHTFRPNGDALNGVGVMPHLIEADPTRQLDLAVTKALELLHQ